MEKLYKITPKNRWRIIVVLSTLLMVILLSGLYENYNLKKINQDFTSLYKDRLIPAAETYFIAEHLHEKRLLLQDLTENGAVDVSEFKEKLTARNHQIDSLVSAYEKTYFVNEESVFFKNFKQNLGDYLASEEKVISTVEKCNFNKAQQCLANETFPIIENIKKDLHDLASIQARVGKELIEGSKFDFASNNLLYYLRFGLTVLIGFFILILVRTSTMMKNSERKKIHTSLKVVKDTDETKTYK